MSLSPRHYSEMQTYKEMQVKEILMFVKGDSIPSLANSLNDEMHYYI
jgi:hypothetical protein